MSLINLFTLTSEIGTQREVSPDKLGKISLIPNLLRNFWDSFVGLPKPGIYGHQLKARLPSGRRAKILTFSLNFFLSSHYWRKISIYVEFQVSSAYCSEKDHLLDEVSAKYHLPFLCPLPLASLPVVTYSEQVPSCCNTVLYPVVEVFFPVRPRVIGPVVCVRIGLVVCIVLGPLICSVIGFFTIPFFW